jgi:hypothetical protein
MISCNELRLGNYVLVENRLQKITMINTDSVCTMDGDQQEAGLSAEHSPEQLFPVILNDDLLTQWGFVFHDYFHFWQKINAGIRSELDIDRDYNVIDFMRKPIVNKLTSLHQLQNVFYTLKGRELQPKEIPAAIQQPEEISQ